MLSIFRPFQSGKADQWVLTSAIGRAWAVGLLDGYEADSAAIRDAGLRFAALHASYGFSSGSQTANYEGEDRRGSPGVVDPVVKLGVEVPRDRRGELYNKLCRSISDAGWASHDAVFALCCDYHDRPWENPPWLDRLINRELAAKGRPVSGYLPKLDGGDERLMKLAVEGLLTIVQGEKRRAA